jgi:hypothetical protein
MEKTVVKQKKLVREMYQACVKNDVEKLSQLRKKEFKKILKHKTQCKKFQSHWTVVSI